MKFWSPLRYPSLGSSLLAASLTFACGSVDPAGPQTGGGAGGGGGGGSAGAASLAGAPAESGAAGASALAEPLLPWAEGNTWTYRVTKDGVATNKTTTVGALEAVGIGPNADLLAHHVVTAKGVELADRTESWQLADATNPLRIVRYREQSFGAKTGELQLDEYWDPGKLHIDGSVERTVRGASWLESYTETKRPVGLSESTHEVREVWTVLDDDATVEVPAGTFEHAIQLQKSGGSTSKQYWYVRGVGKIKETGTQTEELVEFSVAESEP
jgi:hypothetical protein